MFSETITKFQQQLLYSAMLHRTVYLPNVRKDEHFFTSQNIAVFCQVRTESGLLYMESRCVQKNRKAAGLYHQLITEPPAYNWTTSYQSVTSYFKAHPSVPGLRGWTGLLKHFLFAVSTLLSFIIRGHWEYTTGGKGLFLPGSACCVLTAAPSNTAASAYA